MSARAVKREIRKMAASAGNGIVKKNCLYYKDGKECTPGSLRLLNADTLQVVI